MAKSWPSGIDTGAELQFNLLEYCQPPARESPAEELPAQDLPKNSQDTDKNEQTSSPQPAEKEDGNGGSKTEKQETDKEPETITVAEKASKDGDNQKADESNDRNSKAAVALDHSADYPKEYYDSPDLKVIIKGEPGYIAFLVSSHALAMASKEWRSKLSLSNLKDLENHPFGASSDGTIKVLCLDGVDPLSLDILFRVIHWKTEDLPQHLTFDALRKLAIACEKFGCGRVLNPWPLVWMEEYEEQAILPGFEDWMFIAQALDTRNSKAREISRQMILEVSSISKCGTYLRRDVRGDGIAAHTIKVEVNLIPPRILEHILQERTKAVDEVICLLRQFVSNITSASSDSGSFGLTGKEFCRNETCSDIALGSLLRSLKALNLWPLLRSGTPQEWHGSVTTLVMQVETIRMTTFLKAGVVDKLANKEVNELNPESEPEVQKPKTPLKHQSKSKNGVGKRQGPRSSPAPSNSTDSSTSKTQSQGEPTDIPSQNNIKPKPLFGAIDMGEIAFNLYDNKVWETPLFGGMLYSNVMGDLWAATMRELRYEYPAFEATYRLRGNYRPCSSAFALGELITQCRRIITDISTGGYQPGV
ncbi:uncharacterized protein DFL_005466 [Arthrobotrys flagrans]|uniref:BTB domain-containing protein n=1 Tax=Arthrobotrys flagrans TaxID=97331 RepID=A0A436ZXG5_ARTFL|nr:hypothetical protein DFL_005466 [Arthrobotrys flagrans]